MSVTSMPDECGKEHVDLDIRKFAKHVHKVGPEKAFLDFLYGMFVVADEVLRSTRKDPKP